MHVEQLRVLLHDFAALPDETEWCEFKVSHWNSNDTGEYISALSNSAALCEKQNGYIIWGVDNKTHALVGTNFRPRQERVGNEELQNWIARLLSPRIDFRIYEFQDKDRDFVLVEVPKATYTPVAFKGVEYIRIGSYKKKLRDFPEKERALWASFSRESFEKSIARENVTADEVLSLIDYPAYFELTEQGLPDNRVGILARLASEKLITEKPGGHYDITSLGGILFAKDLSAFERLARKAVRVIIYKGNSRIETLREQIGRKGYAVRFEGMIQYINDQLPQNEEIGRALRKNVRMYPEVAIRELVANALIHQDFSMVGTGPVVEIFTNRVEITNPGIPLIDTMRFIDEPPQSRNEALASFMRRINICEERGSGIDKVISSAEVFQLPPPEFTVSPNHTKAVLFARKKLAEMDRKDRIRACYQHACLRYVSNDMMTNATLRKRFSIGDKNYAMASRIIADTLAAELIRRHDPESSSKKHAKYVPFWA